MQSRRSGSDMRNLNRRLVLLAAGLRRKLVGCGFPDLHGMPPNPLKQWGLPPDNRRPLSLLCSQRHCQSGWDCCVYLSRVGLWGGGWGAVTPMHFVHRTWLPPSHTHTHHHHHHHPPVGGSPMYFVYRSIGPTWYQFHFSVSS